jgi:enoyl-CoA hydratase/3-hydroxyacyl-CoA dehydrogenase
VPYEQLDSAIRELIARGRRGDREPAPIPESHRPVARFFDGNGARPADGDAAPEDPKVASALRKLDSKAPIALRIASELIDRSEGLPIEEGVNLELERLEEIFSTADAYEGLSSLGRRPPIFKGA